MSFRRCVQVCVLGCLLGTGATFAADDAAVRPTVEAGVEHVDTGRRDAYEQVLSEFDAAILAAPGDPVPAVEKCRFIAQFADDERTSIAHAEADLDTCTKRINARWPNDPEVRLFNLDQLWGEDAITFGESWLEESKTWPAAERRRLLTKLSYAYGNDNASGRSGDLAVQAAQLGEPSRVAAAVERLVATGHAASAQALLRDAPAAINAWEATHRVTAALSLPDHAAAVAELHRYDNADFEIDTSVATKAFLRAGDIAAARKRLLEDKAETPALQQARFDVAIAMSDMANAAGLIDLSGGKDFALAIQRFAVVAGQAPATLLTGKMLLVAAFFFAVLGLMALAPGLVLVPVHYRGLVRRVRGKPATPLFERIGLRQAWMAGIIVICLPLLVAMVVAPGSVAMLLGGEDLPSKADLLRLTLWGAVLGLLLMVPFVRRIGVRWVVGDRAAWKSWWRVLVAWAILIVVGIVIARLNSHAGDTSTLQTKMVDSLVGGGQQQYGALMTLVLVAVLVPIYEEIVFRGLLLGGMSAHIGFGWANLIQAVLFATVHGDSPRFVLYLTLGLLAGWLVKKSKSLGPGIALHGANNALATLLRIAAMTT